jgi:hypothetical protein
MKKYQNYESMHPDFNIDFDFQKTAWNWFYFNAFKLKF